MLCRLAGSMRSGKIFAFLPPLQYLSMLAILAAVDKHRICLHSILEYHCRLEFWMKYLTTAVYPHFRGETTGNSGISSTVGGTVLTFYLCTKRRLTILRPQVKNLLLSFFQPFCGVFKAEADFASDTLEISGLSMPRRLC